MLHKQKRGPKNDNLVIDGRPFQRQAAQFAVEDSGVWRWSGTIDVCEGDINTAL